MFSVFQSNVSANQNRTNQEKHDVAMDSVGFSKINSILVELKIQKEKLENIVSKASATELDGQKSALISTVFNRMNETDY